MAMKLKQGRKATDRETDRACDAIRRTIKAQFRRLSGGDQDAVALWLARQTSEMLSVLINKLER